jgi:hypothetical protein
MDLQLDIRTKGRAARPVLADVVRDLVPADMALLATERGIKPPGLAKIRDSHHELARAIAEGLKPYEVAIRTGYSLSRVSILSSDPAIQDLVAVYREDRQREFINAQARLALLHTDVVGEIHDRLLDEPEKFDLKDLTDLMVKTADRTGLGPQTKNTNVNVNVDLGSRLERARQRAGLIEGEVVPTLPAPKESVP